MIFPMWFGPSYISSVGLILYRHPNNYLQNVSLARNSSAILATLIPSLVFSSWKTPTNTRSPDRTAFRFVSRLPLLAKACLALSCKGFYQLFGSVVKAKELRFPPRPPYKNRRPYSLADECQEDNTNGLPWKPTLDILQCLPETSPVSRIWILRPVVEPTEKWKSFVGWYCGHMPLYLPYNAWQETYHWTS